METPRQKAFQTLRPPCVELSSAALKFRGKQTTVKAVLHALEPFLSVVEQLGRDNSLDEKLAEYAFFPLSNVFNESQRLSPRCVEVALKSLQILVGRGWRQHLAPKMGKQLLILLSLLGGTMPLKSADDKPEDEVQIAAFDCIATVVQALGSTPAGKSVFDEVGSKTVVDQSVYLLLEAITDSASAPVQVSAGQALKTVFNQISNRVVFASLLPRTVSALTKALRVSTQAKRTHDVLRSNLYLLSAALQAVLSDDVALSRSDPADEVANLTGKEEQELGGIVLDSSWLRATSSQVRIALTHVMKLREHNRAEVREALADLCAIIVERCSRTLAESVPLAIEALVTLANNERRNKAYATLKYLTIANPSLADALRSSLHAWTTSLPRVMQAHDDAVKERVLLQICTTVQVLADIGPSSEILNDTLAFNLVEGIAVAILTVQSGSAQIVPENNNSLNLGLTGVRDLSRNLHFRPVVLNHQSTRDSTHQLETLLSTLGSYSTSNALTRFILGRIESGDTKSQLAAIWAALKLLQHGDPDETIFGDLVVVDDPLSSFSSSRPYLISDLYSLTLPFLIDGPGEEAGELGDWRLTALAMESLVLQANQLGVSYRPELVETLYPVLSLLGSPNSELRANAMTTLDFLAKACKYSSTAAMLIENVDYLVNAIALKLNSFDLVPQAPQVLLVMVRLCGAPVIPYLDDLIGSIFAALDNFHGYPRLVENLFNVLGAIVDEGAKRPEMTITNGHQVPKHEKQPEIKSTVNDITADLRTRNARKTSHKMEDLTATDSAPHRPWSASLDASRGPEDRPGFGFPDGEDMVPNRDAGVDTTGNQLTDGKRSLSKVHSLLLSIAQSAPPHLASPSSHVRLALLQLLTRISPPLCRDEDTFLPLINSIWPSVVQRLFARMSTGLDDLQNQDPAYVFCAAAETVSALCVGAGDFMAGRVEEMFPKLETLCLKVWERRSQTRQRAAQKRKQRLSSLPQKSTSVDQLSGVVDLQIVELGHASRTKGEMAGVAGPSSHGLEVNLDAQIQGSLVMLLVTILNYVRITDDIGDAIVDLLGPTIDELGHENVREALIRWNEDAVWLYRHRLAAVAKAVENG